LFGHLVTKGSFYEKLARCGHELVTDDDLAQMYSKSRGRPSIPPSVLVRALLLAAKDQTLTARRRVAAGSTSTGRPRSAWTPITRHRRHDLLLDARPLRASRGRPQAVC